MIMTPNALIFYLKKKADHLQSTARLNLRMNETNFPANDGINCLLHTNQNIFILQFTMKDVTKNEEALK